MEWANQELERNVKMMERNVQQLEMGKHCPYSKEDGCLNVSLFAKISETAGLIVMAVKNFIWF